MIQIRAINGFPGYFACSNGQILGRKGFISPAKTKNRGYLKVLCIDENGNQRTRYVHRLVALAFIPTPYGATQVNHINGVKTDNRVENLEWVTASENLKHAYATGLKRYHGKNNGTNHGRCKFTEDDVRNIINLCNTTKLTLREIGEMYSVHKTTIHHIKTGLIWRDLHEEVCKL